MSTGTDTEQPPETQAVPIREEKQVDRPVMDEQQPTPARDAGEPTPGPPQAVDVDMETNDDPMTVIPPQARQKRKRKSKEEQLLAKGQKPGNKSRFQGEMGEFLASYHNLYDELPKNNGRRETSALNKFFEPVSTKFWTKFDWKEVRKAYGPEGESWD